jgi:predicted RNase H-like HicB family nuclease
MGQLVEWPEVVTEGKDLEECRDMLRDALNEMILAYKQLNKEMPIGNALIEQLPVEVEHVGQATWCCSLPGSQRILPRKERRQTCDIY